VEDQIDAHGRGRGVKLKKTFFQRGKKVALDRARERSNDLFEGGERGGLQPCWRGKKRRDGILR